MDDLSRVARVSQIYATSTNASDFCRRLTHDPDLGHGLLGTQIFALSNLGAFHLLGSYGLKPFPDHQNFNLFDENPLAEAVRSRTVWFGEIQVADRFFTHWVLPLMKGDVPVGASCSISDPTVRVEPFSMEAAIAASKAGALYLDSLGIKNLFRESAPSEETELTERQYEILLGMARGETNAQIARQMILSESSIKQESVRIFKKLGVGSRQQAVAKAKATGLLPETVFA